jgi:hypothetical protein
VASERRVGAVVFFMESIICQQVLTTQARVPIFGQRMLANDR